MPNPKKHIVFIAAWFYPVNKVASFRINAFAKYIDKNKYTVTVIAYNDQQLLEEEFLDNDIHVYRLKSTTFARVRRQFSKDKKLIHHLKTVNNKVVLRFAKQDYPGWSSEVIKQLRKIHQSNPIDLILSTYAPVDTHVAAYQFKKENPHVKWIADMRDEMSQNTMIQSSMRSKLANWEGLFNQHVDALISVSQPILEGFKKQFSRKDILFKEIKNGFDHELKAERTFGHTFKLLYAGTFYGRRKPDTLFLALQELMNASQLDVPWELILLGTHVNFELPKSIMAHVKIQDSVENMKAIEWMFESDCLLLIHPPTGVKGVYTGKLFDYLSVNRPILALVDKTDVAANLIQEMNAGEIVDFYDVEEIKSALLKMIHQWKEKVPFSISSEKIASLHRRNQTKELENLIELLCHG